MQLKEIPALPENGVVNDECVSYGVGSNGVAIHFIEKDICILIEWPDIIAYGIEILKVMGTKKDESDTVEIEAPSRSD